MDTQLVYSSKCSNSSEEYSFWLPLAQSEMLSPRGQNFGLGLGLKALASALASNIWPRPGLGLQQKNQQPRRDRLTNLFANYRTSHY